MSLPSAPPDLYDTSTPVHRVVLDVTSRSRVVSGDGERRRSPRVGTLPT